MPSASTRTGVYAIVELRTGRSYIGSSAYIHQRWAAHRQLLNKGKHHSAFLQHTWNKYGRNAFEFRVLEECAADKATLLALEQQYLDAFQPVFNVCLIAGSRLGTRSPRTDITHWPAGHEYTPENTHLTKKNQRVCLACVRIKSAERIARETPERTAARLAKGREYKEQHTDTRMAQMREYVATHKAEKREYDKRLRETHAAEINARRKARYAADPEKYREQRRRDHQKHREERLADLAARGKERRRQHREARLAAGTFHMTDTCRKGHAWTPENTLQWKGKRLCRTCHIAARAETPEQHELRLARRRERERASWHDANQRAYQRRKATVLT